MVSSKKVLDRVTRSRSGGAPSHGEQSLQADAGQGVDRLGQNDGFPGRLNAGSAPSRVAFDQDGERRAVHACSLGKTPQCLFGIDRDRQCRPLVQTKQPLDLGLADDIVRDDDISNPGVYGHFGLGKFLAGDAHGASGDLHVCDRRDLVGLEMGPAVDPVRGQVPLHSVDVAFEDGEVDDNDRGLEIVHSHPSFLPRPISQWIGRSTTGTAPPRAGPGVDQGMNAGFVLRRTPFVTVAT